MKGLLSYVKNKLALLLAIMAAAIIGGATTAVVTAAIPDSNGVIHGCRTTATGAIKVIDSASQSCNGLETALNWSQSTGNSGLPFTCGGCSLSEHMGSRLSGKDLSNAFLSNSTFAVIDLTNTNFSNAILVGTSFNSSDLSGANFSSSNLTSASVYSANLSSANLTNANLTGANFGTATGLDTATLTGVTWANTTCPDITNSDDNGGTCVGHLTP